MRSTLNLIIKLMAEKKVDAAETKKATPKKTTKKTSKEKVVAMETEVVKETALKQPKKTTKKINTRVVFQLLGNEIETTTLIEQAKAEFFATGGKEAEIKEIEIYIKPEDNAAYYVINGNVSGKVLIFA